MKNQELENQRFSEEKPLTGVSVLLVEDELDMANLLLFVLQEAGAEVTWVSQAGEALTQLERRRPDILVSNIKLPDRNGDWLIEQIRAAESQRSDHLPAIAVTSYSRDVTACRILEAGFEKFMSKHFESNQLVSAILELLNR